MIHRTILAFITLHGLLVAPAFAAEPPVENDSPATHSLQQTLADEGPESLAAAALKTGDAKLGAVLFHQQQLGCFKCHAAEGNKKPLGPDLATLGKQTAAAHIVESILNPSKEIKKEFQAVQVLDVKGRVTLGFLLKESPDKLELRDPAAPEKTITIARANIDEMTHSPVSIMPAELVNQVGDRAKFLDLVRYVHEIAQGGPAVAKKLEPPKSALVAKRDAAIDHGKQIAELTSLNLSQGKQLYTQHCVSCHGTDGNKTVNPLARRFAKDPLKFGGDPYAIWKTITYGNGLMLPQAAILSPAERYAVVHYLRETFLKPHNAGQYISPDEKYLAGINAVAKTDYAKLAPPDPAANVPPGMISGAMGQQMEYGSYLSHSVVFSPAKAKDGDRFPDTTERALIVKLPGERVACYDTERGTLAGVWTGNLATTAKTHHTSYKGGTCLTPGGPVLLKQVDVPGWAIEAVDQPAGEKDLQFQGHYLHGERVLLKFAVGDRTVEEVPAANPNAANSMTRHLRVAPGKSRLFCLVAGLPEGKVAVNGKAASLHGKEEVNDFELTGAEEVSFIASKTGESWIDIPPAEEPLQFAVTYQFAPAKEKSAPASETIDFAALQTAGPARWTKPCVTTAVPGQPVEGYAADELTLPYANPWGSWMRTTAIDFFSDGRLAVSTLSGDVWIAKFDAAKLDQIEWHRFATGLYEPLGLRIVKDTVYIRGRDRITRLHDTNNDGEADWYENFFQEGEIGPGYHAFIFDLQTDAAGNFYFAKSGRKSPHEGAVIRVPPDGKSFTTFCRDFRHPNGMGAGGPMDWITVSDNPHGKAVFNGVALVREGGKYGHSGPRTQPMLAVLPPTADSSSGGQTWADATRWGPLSGQMIHTSYSRCCAFYVLTQNLEPHPNGFAVRLPFDMKSGAMRARVNPVDGQMYVVGQKGWDTTAKYDGCLYRIRHVPGAAHLVTSAAATRSGIRLGFSCELSNATLSGDSVQVIREEEKGMFPVKLGAVKLADAKTLEIELPEIEQETVAKRSTTDSKSGTTTINIRGPLRITLNVAAADGVAIKQVVYATINTLPAE